MINPQEFTKLLSDLPNGLPVGAPAVTDAWKTWATFNERASGIVLNAAVRSNEIAAGSTQETLSRLRDVSKVRDEAADYAQAVNEFAQAQMALSQRTAEALAGVVKQAQDDTVELVSTTTATATENGAQAAKTVESKAAPKARRGGKAAK